MNYNDIHKDPAFPAMSMDILHNVLSRADNPGQLIDYLSVEIRELTGARCVLLLQYLDETHRILGVNPPRQRIWAESAVAKGLYELTRDLVDVEVWYPEKQTEASKLLHQVGFGLSMAVPLNVGAMRVGSLLLLGMPQQHQIASVTHLLTTLSTIVALVLRNAFLFENQEITISERTKELAVSAFTMDNMHDAVFWINPDASFWKVNVSATTLLGYTNADFLGFKLPDVDTIFSMETWSAHWQELKQAGSLNFESILKGKDGRKIPVDVSSNYFQLDGKEYNCTIVRDISERKRAEEEQAKLQAKYEQAQKMELVGRLAGGVAHDFNNMLGVILGYSEITLGQVDESHPIHSALKLIQQAALRSADLTKQLLACARKQTVAPKVLLLNETVEGMLAMLRRLIGENIDLGWQPGKNPWPIKIDPSQINQILANLCVNARDAIRDTGRIIIETDNVIIDETYNNRQSDFVPGQYVILAVSDNGEGMAPETLSHLFEPFYTTKEVGKGTGLGLATIYGIVKQNNGFVNVYSELGHGTTFRIYLPRHMNAADKVAESLVGREAAVTGRETILLVEDEPMILEITLVMLKHLGYTVLAAASPAEAIRLAREHTGAIHLLMTDVVMPGMNGRDLARKLISLYPTLKRLFMSGYTADVIAPHGVLDVGVHFIQKPFTKKEVATKIREVLDKNQIE